MKPFRILAIDGGGIKGIFPAAFLAELERLTGKRATDYFDLIAGTSTGGIIALALGMGVPAADILAFYKTDGAQIFPTQGRRWRFVQSIFGSKYDPLALRAAIDKVFGTKRLWESGTRLVIPSISASTGDVYLYKTPHHERLRADYDKLASEVALATSAAPTFFPVHDTAAGLQLMDGGLWANNPVMVAAVEAISMLAQEAKDIRALSIGCTTTPMAVKDSMRRGGLAAWARSSVEWLLHGQSISAVNQARHLLGKENVLRVEHVVSPGIYSLDGYKAAKDLEGPGREKARTHSPEIIQRFLEQPKQPYQPLYKVG
jgi:patatin-like phospholipase/acyl hydrolase